MCVILLFPLAQQPLPNSEPMPNPLGVLLALGILCLLAVAVVFAGVALFKRSSGVEAARMKSDDPERSPLPFGQPPAAEPPAGRCPVCGVEVASDSPQGLCPKCLLVGALSHSEQTPEPAEQGETAAYHAPTTAPAVADLAPLFPQLEILELIGQGGMGAVYKARQTKLDRLVAVKVLPAEWGQDPAFAERFAREARALARLSHSHIVAVHDFGETGGLFYLVMEFVDGMNLRQLLKRGPLEPAQALHVIPQICAALQYAHEEGIVHRDIKPENILLDKRGQVKIADFGLAKLMRRSGADYTLTGTRQVMGTLNYMAPEQRTAPQDVDHRADIYSLGVVFYEMLTGDLPLGLFGPPSDKAAVDKRFDAVVFRALEREPDRRYQHISEVKNDVEALARATLPNVLPAPQRDIAQEDLTAEMIQLRVKAPAAGLLITGIVVLLEAAWLAHRSIDLYSEISWDMWGNWRSGAASDARLLAALALAAIAVAATMIAGARKMARLESYGLVRAAIILALLPFSFHWLIGWPIGLWALAVVMRPKVQAAFALNLRRSQRSQDRFTTQPAKANERKPTGPIFGVVGSALGSMLSLFVHRPTAASSPSMPGPGLENATAEKARATPVRQAKDTDTTDVPRGRGWGRSLVLVATVIVLVGFILLLGGGLAFLLVPVSVKQDETIEGKVGKAKLTDDWQSLAFHRGNPALINVAPDAREAINEILRSADQAYLKIEQRYAKRTVDKLGNPTVTVMPFKEELKNLEDRVWLQLQAVFPGPTFKGAGRPMQWEFEKARTLLPIHGSLFPFGTEEITIELARKPDGFRWRLSKPGDPGMGQWFNGPQLPEEYARFWEK